MKKLLLLGAVTVAVFAASSQARAGISFSISLGHHHHRPPVVVAPPPVVVSPPVVAYPRHCAPAPVVVYPTHCAPAPRYVYRGHDRCDHRGHAGRYAYGGYRQAAPWHGHAHGLRVESPRGGFAMNGFHR